MSSRREETGSKGFCVIMAGGRGTRFWPLSRTDRPKQLLPLGSDRSLLRETYDRVAPLVGPQRVLVVVSGNLAEAVHADLPELPAEHVITEPIGRNTAPCAALGIGVAAKLQGDGPVALLPADHRIPDPVLFREQLEIAFDHAGASGQVVTFGIPPTNPATGYGYIEVEQAGDDVVAPGLGFVEKPDLNRAQQYVAGGHHFWNSGMFVWDSVSFAEALAGHLPEVAELIAPAVAAYGTPHFDDALATAYEACPAVSIDVGVMEKVAAFAVIKASFRWSDLGSWDAWGELAEDLGQENRGQADLLAVASRGNIIHSPDKLVALVGVDDLIVVDSGDALLVCHSRDAQRLREVITRLENMDRKEFL